jgi:glycerate dehydrogenase
MKKINILGKVAFSVGHQERLAEIAKNYNLVVEYHDCDRRIVSEEVLTKIKDSKVVVVDWVDPSPFILSLESGTLVSLLSTGYGWIKNLEAAKKNGVLVSNIPEYSTDAVAEHIFGLLLAYSKKIIFTSNWSKKFSPNLIGFQLKGKTLGIIGLGNIGTRVAEIAKALKMNVITFNRTKKDKPIARDVELNELLSTSDVVCVTCSLNEQSRNMINRENILAIKRGAVITGATWGVIEELALKQALDSGRISAVALDVALEGSDELQNKELLSHENFFCTFHNAYNTVEATKVQADTCLDNIERFLIGKPQNIIN